jgi:hypothetical protein
MKLKILPIVIVFLLMLSGVNAIATNFDNKKISIATQEDSVFFSTTSIKTDGKYINLEIKETQQFITKSNEPMLPVFTKTYVFPLGTKINKVDCRPHEIFETEIEGKIKPAPKSISKISITKTSYEKNSDLLEGDTIYSSKDLYPNNWYDYKITCGLKGEKHVIFVTINFYPIRYSPANNLLYQTNGADFLITHEKSSKPKISDDEYDMVIITPNKFTKILEPLVEHKNDVGIKTTVKTVESICKRPIFGGYEGRDEAEQVKYFIKEAIENWGVKYVLLFGGRVRQSFQWHVPVRYSNLDDWGSWETSFLSDLYFSDVYRYNESSDSMEFEDWDSNGNGIFAEWYRGEFVPDDELDLYPDVYLGRLAVRNLYEAETVVNKIIYYEKNTFGKDWFKKIVCVGGDTSPTLDKNSSYYYFYEGEIETGLGGSYLEPLGFEVKKLFASQGNVTTYKVVESFNDGAGFFYFSGHSNPIVWSTHPPNDLTWIDALYNTDMVGINNHKKLPICIVGGCHSSQFDVTNRNLIRGLLKERLKYFVEPDYDEGGFWKAEWASRCWSWNLAGNENGTIATIGNTGLGWGKIGLDCTDSLDGWITSHFFDVYANQSQQGNNTLGLIHGKTLSDYISTFSNSWDRDDGKTVEGWALLGDPSLKIGGYPPII